MNPTDFYQHIVLTTPDDLPDKVFRVLTRHIGWDVVQGRPFDGMVRVGILLEEQ